MSRCVVFILLFAAANWAGASQGPVIRDDEAIRKMLSTRVDLQKQATGIVVGVIDYMGSRIVSYGTMGLSDRRPVNGDTVFDVGSITKVLTALLLADMAQRGEVNLDDPGIRPQFHTFVADRAPWDTITDDLPQYPERRT